MSIYKHVFYPRSLQVLFVFQILSNIFKTLFGSTPKTLFFSKNIMTPPRLTLVKAQQSFLSGIRLSRELHGLKVKETAPLIKKPKVGTLRVLALSRGKENTVKIQNSNCPTRLMLFES